MNWRIFPIAFFAVLPPGVVPHGFKPIEKPPLTLKLLEHGRERYRIYCEVCHGMGGDGDGIATLRGFPRPPTFHNPSLRSAPAEFIFEVAKKGRGDMLGYGNRVPEEDLWAITAYVRALQRSRDTPYDELSGEEKANLGGQR